MWPRGWLIHAVNTQCMALTSPGAHEVEPAVAGSWSEPHSCKVPLLFLPGLQCGKVLVPPPDKTESPSTLCSPQLSSVQVRGLQSDGHGWSVVCPAAQEWRWSALINYQHRKGLEKAVFEEKMPNCCVNQVAVLGFMATGEQLSVTELVSLVLSILPPQWTRAGKSTCICKARC